MKQPLTILLLASLLSLSSCKKEAEQSRTTPPNTITLAKWENGYFVNNQFFRRLTVNYSVDTTNLKFISIRRPNWVGNVELSNTTGSVIVTDHANCNCDITYSFYLVYRNNSEVFINSVKTW